MSDSNSKNLIIGSGPASVGAAITLDYVNVADAGESLESATANRAGSTRVWNRKRYTKSAQ